MVLFIVMHNLILTFESMDKIVQCDYSNESYWAVLSCGAFYYAVQGGSDFWVCGWNRTVWPFKWKLLSSTFLWCWCRTIWGRVEECVNYVLTNPTLVTNDEISIVIHRALSNIVPEIWFCYLVPWIQMHSEVKRAVWKVGTVNPLAVSSPAIEVITSGRYALASTLTAVILPVKTRITPGVLQTEAGFVTLSYLLSILFA